MDPVENLRHVAESLNTMSDDVVRHRYTRQMIGALSAKLAGLATLVKVSADNLEQSSRLAEHEGAAMSIGQTIQVISPDSPNFSLVGQVEELREDGAMLVRFKHRHAIIERDECVPVDLCETREEPASGCSS